MLPALDVILSLYNLLAGRGGGEVLSILSGGGTKNVPSLFLCVHEEENFWNVPSLLPYSLPCPNEMESATYLVNLGG